MTTTAAICELLALSGEQSHVRLCAVQSRSESSALNKTPPKKYFDLKMPKKIVWLMFSLRALIFIYYLKKSVKKMRDGGGGACCVPIMKVLLIDVTI